MSAQAPGPTALQLLESIQPPTRPRRFLQSWDRDSRVLRFACGDNANAVQVGSDESVESVKAERSTKLRATTVKTFLGRPRRIENPFADVRSILSEYLFFKDERIFTLLAAWITGTYFYSIFSHFGYVFLHSEEPRCGKTRTEEITSHLAFEATTPRNAPTPPTMRETAAEGGTAIFDTLERWKEKSTESYGLAMELLDAGFRNGGVVAKMVSVGPGEWQPKEYEIFAPYMFAAIKVGSIADTAQDRSFLIEMRRKSTKLKKRSYSDARCETQCAPLRDRLYLTALTHARRVADTYDSTELERHVDALGLNDRAVDIWKPLLAVTRAFGEDAITRELSQLAQDMSQDPDRKEEKHQLDVIRALRSAIGAGGSVTNTTQGFIEMLQRVTPNVDCSDLREVLVSLRFEERSIRLAGLDTPRRGWQIDDVQLESIERFLSETGYGSETAPTTPTTPSPAGGSDGQAGQ